MTIDPARHSSTSPPALLDIGINLAHDSFDPDRDAVIERARDVGVTRMVITGSSLDSTHAAIDLVQRYPEQMRCTAGVHPHHAVDLDSAQLQAFGELARRPEVVAVGECGLDYFRNFSPHAAQTKAFEEQLELAADVRKPVFLHQRDAHQDFMTIMRKHRAQLAGGVAHCFTAGLEEARAYLDLDLYIGITGWICDERRGHHLREVVRHIPAERLLIETDGPYLLPRDLHPKPQSRRNEPMYLPHVLAAIAKARGETVEMLAEITTANALRLFNWQTA
ncbi:YchF/TatD family DNA exonuclease [Steroidobacter sp. S1-65]|uniref:YchF/TatD family DNA exonuclease n=1 Tax=Steroidobacter gossypii TaxID=2805490 RepID=A0ABS1WX16_9GAMM|nr:TatD family hydrolase [Steroidobacter gossypii]MBM0105519.1 YchF/TatD family DNA exonuclease [Steroidobacter gossypii]